MSERSDEKTPLPTPAELAVAEQAFALAADNLPPFWGRMFKNLLDEDFTRPEALDLVKNWIKDSKDRT